MLGRQAWLNLHNDEQTCGYLCPRESLVLCATVSGIEFIIVVFVYLMALLVISIL